MQKFWRQAEIITDSRHEKEGAGVKKDGDAFS